MSEEAAQKPKAAKKRRWWKWLKRVSLVLLALLVVVAVFHKTIIFEGTRYFVVRAAKQQNLDLDYRIEGSIFSRLRVYDLVGKPTEKGPIERLEVGEILLEYSIWGVIRDGLPALLKVVELHDVFVVIEPGEPVAETPKEEKKPQAFKFPGLFPERLVIENVNFQTVGESGGFELKGLTFTLLPNESGKLVVAKLDVPGVRTWDSIEGETSFKDRNLLLTDLAIGPEIRIETFNLNASELGEAVLGVGLAGRVFDADLSLTLVVKDLNATNDLKLDVNVSGLAFGKLWSYLNLEVPFGGSLNELEIRFAGLPTEPKGWDGTVRLRTEGLVAAEQFIGAVGADVTIKDGQVNAVVVDDLGDANRVEVRAEAVLPEKLEEFAKIDAKGWLQADLTKVGAVAEGVEGGATARVDFRMENQFAFIDLKVGSERLLVGENTVSGLEATAHVEKNLATEKNSPVYEDLLAKFGVTVATVRAGEFDIEKVSVAATVEGPEVKVTEVSLAKGVNKVRLSADYQLPADMKSFVKQPASVDVLVDAPELGAFVAEGSGADLSGALKIDGKLTSTNGEIDGNFDIVGSDVKAAGLEIPTIEGGLTIKDNQANLAKLAIVLNDENRVTLDGTVELAEPFAYSGSIDVALGNLAVFDPVSPEALGGALKLTWSGEGNVKANTHTGKADVVLENGKFGERDELAATVAANYDWPKSVEIPVIKASAKAGDVSLAVLLAENRLSVTDLIARLGQLQVLSGSVSVPLHADHLDDLNLMIPNDESVAVNLETGTLKLGEVFAQLPMEEAPPVTGTVGLTVGVSGTLEQLKAAVAVRANDLQSTAADVKPADVSLDVLVANDRATIEGRITQPLVQPITINGALPVDVVSIRRDGNFPMTTPIDLKVRMPKSSLGFVSSLVPVVRFIEGTAAVDLVVGGTVEKPAIDGTVEADVPAVRLSVDGFPPVTNVIVRIESNAERLTIPAFRGDIGGGVFGAEGGITFGGVEKPVFDLAVGTRDALVMQNEAITLRISSRIELTGPLDGANVGGAVYVTKSRFYKDIDILPIGLPGRPAPQPPPAPTVQGITAPPLSNWTFDLDVKTSDPFLVQGNLANGRIVIDLNVSGTGAQPTMSGDVRIEQLTTSLPFSELTIRNGIIFFRKDNPFIANLDIRGTSEIRDYEVTAFIYGNQNDPQVTFSSQPPLPQTDIISLIATGVTSEDIAGNPSVLAGRAAVLLFQKISRSIFPPKDPSERKKTVLNDIDFAFGEIDPKTGRQSATVRFPLSKSFSLFGGVDVQGDFRGQVKYLIRFQ